MLRQQDEQTDLLYAIRAWLRNIFIMLVILTAVEVGWHANLHAQIAHLIRVTGG